MDKDDKYYLKKAIREAKKAYEIDEIPIGVVIVLDNKIIDLYRVFNGVYFNFELKIFQGKPLFVVIGGNFNEYLIDCKKELFMATSIKIYDATELINNKTGQYPPSNIYNSKEEPYPKII